MMDYRFMMLGKNAFLFGDILNDIFMTKKSRYENQVTFSFINPDSKADMELHK
jgi:hypothetical protein